jgi:hypothetical protein
MHIEDQVFKRFHVGVLDTEELITVLEHIETCSYCADKLMKIDSGDMEQAPVYLKDNIIKRTQMPDIKAKVKISSTSKKVELLVYSLKTTAAVLGALILLVSISYVNTSSVMHHPDKVSTSVNWGSELHEKSNEVVNIMNNFSNRIINGGKN